MDWYPGAYRVEVGGNGGTITARPAENVLHIAASAWNIDPTDPLNPGKGIAGWTAGARACNGYVDQFGAMQQYCSVWSSVNGTKDGNWRCRTWESWNPEGNGSNGGDYDSSTWTAEQCERFSDLMAWDNNENGALLQDMRNSLRGSHGCGVHRYGITGYDPWRSVGGEVWSTSSSKVCPGSARVRQLSGIVARAMVIAEAVRSGRCTYLSPGRVNLTSALARTASAAEKDWDEMATPQEIAALVGGKVIEGVANGNVLAAIGKAVLTTDTGTVTGDGQPQNLAALLTAIMGQLQVINARLANLEGKQ